VATSGYLQTYGGYPATGTITNVDYYNYLAGRPRQASIITFPTGTLNAVGAVTGDTGLFYSAPSVIFGALNISPVSITITGAAVTGLAMGGKPDIIQIQPAP